MIRIPAMIQSIHIHYTDIKMYLYTFNKYVCVICIISNCVSGPVGLVKRVSLASGGLTQVTPPSLQL